MFRFIKRRKHETKFLDCSNPRKVFEEAEPGSPLYEELKHWTIEPEEK